MPELRHWLVFSAKGAPYAIRDEDRAAAYRTEGYQVEGPFVLEAEQPAEPAFDEDRNLPTGSKRAPGQPDAASAHGREPKPAFDEDRDA